MVEKTNAKTTKMYVLDTNILLHEPFAFLSFQEHEVVIPMTVLEELDQIKDRNKDVSRDARVAIRALEDMLRDATPEDMLNGVPLPCSPDGTKPAGHLIIVNDYQLDNDMSGLPGGDNDNRIINTALCLQKREKNSRVSLVTKDINMRIKAKGAGLAC
jgi:PhoH-like ATPase